MNEKDFDNKKESYIDFLKHDASLQLNWAQKKEVAVWTATVFYIGVVYALFRIFLIDNKTSLDQTHLIALLIISSLFFLAIISFIWSNFQSIYHSHAYYNAVKKVITNIFYNDTIPSLENTKQKKQTHSDFLQKKLKQSKKSMQRNQTKLRPAKVMVSFWPNFFLTKKAIKRINSFLPKKWNINIGKQLARQESVLYSRILLPTLLFWYLVVIRIFC